MSRGMCPARLLPVAAAAAAVVIAVACAPGPAAADPMPATTAYVAFGMGPAPRLTGSLGARLEETGLGGSAALGGSVGRLGIELELMSGSFDDTAATDSRDRERVMILYGLAARWALADSRFAALYVRGGLLLGSLNGLESEIPPGPCDPEVPHACDSMSYTPPGMSAWGGHAGFRAQVQVPIPEGGFAALFAQADTSLLRVGVDGGTAALATTATIGVSFGTRH